MLRKLWGSRGGFCMLGYSALSGWPEAPCCASPREVTHFFSKGWSQHSQPFSWPEGVLGPCPVQRESRALQGLHTHRLPLCRSSCCLSFLLALLCSVHFKIDYFPWLLGPQRNLAPILSAFVRPSEDKLMCRAAPAPFFRQGFSTSLPIRIIPGA